MRSCKPSTSPPTVFARTASSAGLNTTPGRAVAISPLLTQLIAAALRGARLSGGAVDPTVGSAVKLAGYDSDFATLAPDGMAIELAVSRVPGWQAIVLMSHPEPCASRAASISTSGPPPKRSPPHLAAAAAFAKIGQGGVLVSLGGDIAVRGRAAGGRLAHPGQRRQRRANPGRRGDDQHQVGAASPPSSTTVRRWTRGGVLLHHINRPGHRPAKRRSMADGHRNRRQLRRRQHRIDGRRSSWARRRRRGWRRIGCPPAWWTGREPSSA